MNLLHLDSSILGANSVSRLLSAEVVETERKLHPDLLVTYRDVAADPIGHVSGSHLAAAAAGAVELQAALQHDVARGQAALDEFLAADVVVIGAPMYNFTIPSQLKAWIDRIAVAGKTFRYGPNGPEGLAGGKKIIIVSSRGGVYTPGSPAAPLEHHESYLRAVFGFLGVTDITVVRAEGMAVSELREKGLSSARKDIAALV